MRWNELAQRIDQKTIQEKLKLGTKLVIYMLVLLSLIGGTALFVLGGQIKDISSEVGNLLRLSQLGERSNELLQTMHENVSSRNKDSLSAFSVRYDELLKDLSLVNVIDSSEATDESDTDAETTKKGADLHDLFEKSTSAMRAVFQMVADGNGDDAEFEAVVVEELYGEYLAALRKQFNMSREALEMSMKAAATKTLIPIVTLIAASAVIIFLTMLVNRMIQRSISPMKEAIPVISAISDGDLTKTLTHQKKDEVGQIAEALNAAISSMRNTIIAIGNNANNLNSTSQEMTSVSDRVNNNATETVNHVMGTMEAVDKITQHIQSVSSSIEEISATNNEIVNNSKRASDVADDAVANANATNDRVNALGESSREISNVVDIIASIAEQTNLLALNAAIEAARAGEAGKGFAVVANEVKALAAATSNSTDDVASRIKTMQTATESVVQDIGKIFSVLESIKDGQSSIVVAITQQNAALNYISKSMADTEDLVESDISSRIRNVNEVANITTEEAEKTRTISGELTKMAGDLQQLVSQFKC